MLEAYSYLIFTKMYGCILSLRILVICHFLSLRVTDYTIWIVTNIPDFVFFQIGSMRYAGYQVAYIAWGKALSILV